MLTFLRDEDTVPNLKRLCMAGSQLLTDAGLFELGESSERRRDTLEYIDITFCNGTTYGATLPLRRLFSNNLVIRRQPAWLDGQFRTPFGEGEVHTYWADGTFSFTRPHESTGYVRHLRREGNVLCDSLQYIDFDAPPFWPAWVKYCYRPGVALQRVPSDGADDGLNAGEHSVLVGQLLIGLLPPMGLPSPPPALEVGGQAYFDVEGNPVAPAPDDGIPSAHLMVSRMPVMPPSEGHLMPPLELIERIEAFEAEMLEEIRQRRIHPLGEEVIHEALLQNR
mmetsp:Transcript_29303/g.93927  ORF Transcript_29303/g.93927 Transcript_29303/m.93927 type:complete len:280 (+) Transcript_29303:680-1519(+)